MKIDRMDYSAEISTWQINTLRPPFTATEGVFPRFSLPLLPASSRSFHNLMTVSTCVCIATTAAVV